MFALLKRFRGDGRNTTKALRTGRFGEDQAVKFLRRKKRFRIVTRNWRFKKGEIDIVAWDGSLLVFVEVRARNASALVSGYHSLTARKKKVLLETCKAYLLKLKRPPKFFRFDVVELKLGKERSFDLTHFENVSLFPEYFHPFREK